MKLIDKVLDYVKKENMLVAGDKVVLGLSGGADSVCLFRVLLSLRELLSLELIAVNVEHGIRGLESLEDTEFVKALCRMNGIECRCFSYDIPALAREWGMSTEEAGRKARYQAFDMVYEETGATKIAVAHNANDNVETIIHNMARGTGLAGMAGIPAARDRIIRPILCLSRKEIEDYLEELKQDYRNDSTNDSLDYTRNKIRHNILPALCNINGEAMTHIGSLGREAEEINEYLMAQAQIIYKRIVVSETDRIVIDIKAFEAEPVFIKGMIIRLAIKELHSSLRDISRQHISYCLELLDKETGKTINLPNGLMAEKSYDRLILSLDGDKNQKTEENVPVRLALDGRTRAGKLSLNTSFPVKEGYIIPKNVYTKGFDYDRIRGTLYLRHRQAGDTIIIDSQGRRTKLKDYFINEKIPLEDRDRLWLLCDDYEIIWIIGYRISEYYKINENTQNIIQLEVMEDHDGRQD